MLSHCIIRISWRKASKEILMAGRHMHSFLSFYVTKILLMRTGYFVTDGRTDGRTEVILYIFKDHNDEWSASKGQTDDS